ncbi:MAG: hypothetical protein KJ072_08780 [Verrucomicrobia bacterium]|nr:hypothetical protein [Verrucomicrobiota bacterium]
MRASPSRIKAWTLIGLFGLILGVVPVTQVALEWRRGERIQAMDLFRYAPRSEHLRRYERDLEARCWVPAVTRPAMRETWFAWFGDPGRQALLGRDGWLFYRPGVRYLVEPDQVDTTPGDVAWREPGRESRRERALRMIVEFRDQLREREIELLVVPVPGKASVYPDRLSRRYARGIGEFRSPTEDFIGSLEAAGIEVVDLFSRFREEREKGEALYLEQDTHWTPLGAEVAAESVGARLKGLGWVTAGTNAFWLREVRVRRWGDIIELTRVSGLSRQYPGQVISARQVIDRELGLLVPSRSDRPGTYRDPRGGAEVLLLGDSFSRVYQYAEPQSLGEATDPAVSGLPREPDPAVAARLYPGSAGLVAHLTRVLARPVDAIVSDGGATTDVRRRLSVNPEILEGKRVVVWEFVERDLGQGEWAEVPLPRELGEGR